MTEPTRQHELAALRAGARVVAGIDEVGRGAWAGPVVAAAVVLPAQCDLPGCRDSKQLSPARRDVMAAEVHAVAAVGVGEVAARELDQRGLTWAVAEAGRRALTALPTPPDLVLLDGLHDYFAGQRPVQTIVKGDASELCIAAASVVAKVHRDQLMTALDATVPGYSFGSHKGYGTVVHRQALVDRGSSMQHRRSWAPLQALAEAG